MLSAFLVIIAHTHTMHTWYMVLIVNMLGRLYVLIWWSTHTALAMVHAGGLLKKGDHHLVKCSEVDEGKGMGPYRAKSLAGRYTSFITPSSSPSPPHSPCWEVGYNGEMTITPLIPAMLTRLCRDFEKRKQCLLRKSS